MTNSKILLNQDDVPFLTDENKTVPAVCPYCGAKVGLYFCGEPVFLCENTVKSDHKIKHYFGTLKFPEEVLENGKT